MGVVFSLEPKGSQKDSYQPAAMLSLWGQWGQRRAQASSTGVGVEDGGYGVQEPEPRHLDSPRAPES